MKMIHFKCHTATFLYSICCIYLYTLVVPVTYKSLQNGNELYFLCDSCSVRTCSQKAVLLTHFTDNPRTYWCTFVAVWKCDELKKLKKILVILLWLLLLLPFWLKTQTDTLSIGTQGVHISCTVSLVAVILFALFSIVLGTHVNNIS